MILQILSRLVNKEAFAFDSVASNWNSLSNDLNNPHLSQTFTIITFWDPKLFYVFNSQVNNSSRIVLIPKIKLNITYLIFYLFLYRWGDHCLNQFVKSQFKVLCLIRLQVGDSKKHLSFFLSPWSWTCGFFLINFSSYISVIWNLKWSYILYL